MTPQDHLQKWLNTAKEVAETSDHTKVKVGCVIVAKNGRRISSSANSIVAGIDKLGSRLEDGKKSSWIACAEQVSIAIAATKGKSTKGATLYTTLSPCSRCADTIIAAKIASVVILDQPHPPHLKEKWRKSLEIGEVKLKEANVQLIHIKL